MIYRPFRFGATSQPGPIMMRTRGLRLGLCAALGLRAGPALAQDTPALQRLLVAEDARGTGPDGLSPLVSALRGPDTLLRRLAVRGLGRAQRPELVRLL